MSLKNSANHSGILCLSVWAQYPLPYPKQEGMIPVIDGTFLTFVIAMSGLSPADETRMRTGPMWYGLYAHKNIPFILAKFGGVVEFDSYLNIHLESEEVREKFLSAENMDANVLQYHIVDTQNGVLRVLRALGSLTSYLPAIKRLCANQLTFYPSSSAVHEEAELVLNRYSTEELIRSAKMIEAGATSENSA